MQQIRNFAIIAHVDHGKSTLADRLLEITGTVEKRRMQNQLLDSNPIERERGITIKLAPVRMHYQNYILNLIDTPGHVDFSYEVSRSLAACEGAILLVDATQGVQAQTLAHYQQAKKLGLTIIPVINKIDINTADVTGTQKQISEILNLNPDSILLVSAKTGAGIPELLQAVISRIPQPSNSQITNNQLTRALVFNSNFDPHLGVIAWNRMVDGQIKTGDKIYLLGTGATASAIEVGVFTPQRAPTQLLSSGEVGYVVTNLKDLSLLTAGDTLTNLVTMNQVTALPGYSPIKPVVFVSFYPTEGSEINTLRGALSKLQLSDSALTFVPEFSPALGNGFRVGLLGLLHADIVQERLEREFGLDLIAAAPSVSYQILTMNDKLITINQASALPDPSVIKEIREPMLDLSIFVPQQYIGPVIQLCQNHRGFQTHIQYLALLVQLSYSLPLAELIRGFYNSLKSVSQGFATLDYELASYQTADLVKLDVLIAGDKIDALSQIIPRAQAPYLAKNLVDTLQNVVPRQNFEVPIQASIGSHILARADVKAYRKDVIAKLSGGDQTRKDKLLKIQKKGKARMKRVGRIDIPQEAFLSILKI